MPGVGAVFWHAAFRDSTVINYEFVYDIALKDVKWAIAKNKFFLANQPNPGFDFNLCSDMIQKHEFEAEVE